MTRLGYRRRKEEGENFSSNKQYCQVSSFTGSMELVLFKYIKFNVFTILHETISIHLEDNGLFSFFSFFFLNLSNLIEKLCIINLYIYCNR
jgi:hypothetical protein